MLRFDIGQAYLWQDDEELTLVDTGPPDAEPAITGAIRSVGRDPAELRRIVLTHFHGDHTGSAAVLREKYGVPVHAHPADAPMIRGERPGPPPVLLDWERPLFDRVGVSALLTGPPVPVDHEVDEGDELGFGDGARVLSIPGHTEGSIAVHLPGHRVLFTGDAVARTGDRVILGVFNQDHERATAAFHRLSEVDSDVACFGHGDPVRTGSAADLREAVAGLGA
jgi:glyoxylase-like metal-dependent hydrolase (beta-lactamase superfamily II)